MENGSAAMRAVVSHRSARSEIRIIIPRNVVVGTISEGGVPGAFFIPPMCHRPLQMSTERAEVVTLK